MERRFGIIGNPVSHSRSAVFFSERFARTGQEASYARYCLDSIGKLTGLLKSEPALAGFNVTSPFKQAVMPFLDCLSPEAERIGAVNVVRIDRSEAFTGSACGLPGVRLTGFNTDCLGFRDSLTAQADWLDAVRRRPALVLGTGGAARAVACALQELEIDFTLVSRSPSLGTGYPVRAYQDLTAGSVAGCGLIVNATPLGMPPRETECAAIPYEALGPQHWLYDLVYHPAETLFLQRGRLAGARSANGGEMFRRQALATAAVWRV